MNYIYFLIILMFSACASKSTANSREVETEQSDLTQKGATTGFNADSAYRYIEQQVAFGPRVPNSAAHVAAGDWLATQLKRHGAETIVQQMQLKAFDGTILNAKNIFGSFNPDKKDRILLLAHWDCRPWADQDPDPEKRKQPVDGANDGASGIGILLEMARLINQSESDKGIDILFVDAEDWGTEGDEDSWALGTHYFIENPPIVNYAPKYAILLDMTGGEGATFCREYFSERSASWLANDIWKTAADLGYGDIFLNVLGSAVTDDHVQLIENGIPAIDIIDYRPGHDGGFNPRWHTASDNMEGISKETLKAVGDVLCVFLGI